MTAIHVSRRGFLGALASAAGALLVPKPKAISYFFGMGLPIALPGVQTYLSMDEMDRAMRDWFGGKNFCEEGDFTKEWLGSRRQLSSREVLADPNYKPIDWSERGMWARRRAERQARRRRVTLVDGIRRVPPAS